MAVASWRPRWPQGSPNAHPKTAPVPGRRFVYSLAIRSKIKKEDLGGTIGLV